MPSRCLNEHEVCGLLGPGVNSAATTECAFRFDFLSGMCSLRRPQQMLQNPMPIKLRRLRTVTMHHPHQRPFCIFQPDIAVQQFCALSIALL